MKDCTEYVDLDTGELRTVIEIRDNSVLFNTGQRISREEFDEHFEWYSSGICAECLNCGTVYRTARMKNIAPRGDDPLYMCGTCYNKMKGDTVGPGQVTNPRGDKIVNELANQIAALVEKVARADEGAYRVLLRDRFITVWGTVRVDGGRFYVTGRDAEAAFDASDIDYIEGEEINLKC